MDDINEISKKELLTQTGISYGQLYRWKREGLIPESWFVKKSAFTGQETFFPREPMLARVSVILSMKDNASLEAIRQHLEVQERPRLLGTVLTAMLQRPDAAQVDARDFSASEASLDNWALAAGILEGGRLSGVPEAELTRLIEQLLQASDAPLDSTVRPSPAQVSLLTSKSTGDTANNTNTNTNNNSASNSIGSRAGNSVEGGNHHLNYHYLVSDAPVQLSTDAALTILATKPLQPYRDRAQAAGAGHTTTQ